MGEIIINSATLSQIGNGDTTITESEFRSWLASTGQGTTDLNVRFDLSSGTGAITLNLDDGDANKLDFDRININDAGTHDIQLIVADSDGLLINETASGTALSTTTTAASALGSLSVTDKDSSKGLTLVSRALNVTLGDITTTGNLANSAYVNNYNIANNINVSGATIAASRIDINKTQELSQNDSNIAGIVNVNLNIDGSADSSAQTQVNYNVNLKESVAASTAKLSGMAAGTQVNVNQTGGTFSTSGNIEVNVDSTLGDSQAEAFARQLSNFTPPAGFGFKDGAADLSIATLIAGLRGADSATWLAKINNGQISIVNTAVTSAKGAVSSTPSSQVWVNGNGTGNWHTHITITNDPTAANATGSTMGNTGDVTIYIPKSVSDAAGLVAGQTYIGYNLSQNQKNVIAGGYAASTTTTTSTDTTTTTQTRKLGVLSSDSFALDLGANVIASSTVNTLNAPVTVTKSASACRMCDPVALINIQNLGGSGSLYAEATNTATLRDFVGTTTVSDNGAGGAVGSGYATLQANGYQFKTGVQIANATDVGAVSSYVDQNVTASGVQKNRDSIKMTGGFYNDAATKLSSGQGRLNTTTGLNMSGFDSSGANAVQTNSVLQDFLRANPSVNLNDVSTWTPAVLSKLNETNTVLTDAQASQALELWNSHESDSVNASEASLLNSYAQNNADLALTELGFGSSVSGLGNTASFMTSANETTGTTLFSAAVNINQPDALTLLDTLNSPPSNISNAIINNVTSGTNDSLQVAILTGVNLTNPQGVGLFNAVAATHQSEAITALGIVNTSQPALGSAIIDDVAAGTNSSLQCGVLTSINVTNAQGISLFNGAASTDVKSAINALKVVDGKNSTLGSAIIDNVSTGTNSSLQCAVLTAVPVTSAQGIALFNAAANTDQNAAIDALSTVNTPPSTLGSAIIGNVATNGSTALQSSVLVKANVSIAQGTQLFDAILAKDQTTAVNSLAQIVGTKLSVSSAIITAVATSGTNPELESAMLTNPTINDKIFGTLLNTGAIGRMVIRQALTNPEVMKALAERIVLKTEQTTQAGGSSYVGTYEWQFFQLNAFSQPYSGYTTSLVTTIAKAMMKECSGTPEGVALKINVLISKSGASVSLKSGSPVLTLKDGTKVDLV